MTKPYLGSVWSGDVGTYSAHWSARNAGYGWDCCQRSNRRNGWLRRPRLNALGSFDDPNPAIDLLTGLMMRKHMRLLS